ncbi:hypothetical protein Dimus_001229, partial [Dionaea muscipula]
MGLFTGRVPGARKGPLHCPRGGSIGHDPTAHAMNDWSQQVPLATPLSAARKGPLAARGSAAREGSWRRGERLPIRPSTGCKAGSPRGERLPACLPLVVRPAGREGTHRAVVVLEKVTAGEVGCTRRLGHLHAWPCTCRWGSSASGCVWSFAGSSSVHVTRLRVHGGIISCSRGA